VIGLEINFYNENDIYVLPGH